jgi:hypothetical protein
MYFSDFIKAKTPPTGKRYFLSGTNTFAMEIVTGALSSYWNRKVKWISSKADVSFMRNALIFPQEQVYVIGSNLDIDVFSDYTIKRSKNKITKKYKDSGFQEIVCGDLFPGQVEELTKAQLETFLHQKVSPNLVKFICYCNNYNLVSIWNCVSLIEASGRDINSIPLGELVLYGGDITATEGYSVVNHFVEGNYTAFIQDLYKERKLSKEILWSLLATILKSQSVPAGAKTWYERRMLDFRKRMDGAGACQIVGYLNDLAKAHALKTEQIFNQLCRFVLYLNGSIVNLR